MDAADLARENTLLKARLAQVEVVLAETQEANRRLQDILRAALPDREIRAREGGLRAPRRPA